MHKYKLLYFNGHGNGEPIRYIFALAGQEYTDYRVELEEEWPKVKPTTLWGMLPELTIDDDQPICQTQTICRVLGKHFGLMGMTQQDEIRIGMLMECIEDVVQPLCMLIFFEEDETRKDKAKKDYEKKYSDLLGRLEVFLCSNNGGDGWFVGDSVSVADCFLYSKLTWLPVEFPNCFDNFPKLTAFMKRFENHDKIAAWMAKRPKTVWFGKLQHYNKTEN